MSTCTESFDTGEGHVHMCRSSIPNHREAWHGCCVVGCDVTWYARRPEATSARTVSEVGGITRGTDGPARTDRLREPAMHGTRGGGSFYERYRIDPEVLYQEVSALVASHEEESPYEGMVLLDEARWTRVVNVVLGYPPEFDGESEEGPDGD